MLLQIFENDKNNTGFKQLVGLMILVYDLSALMLFCNIELIAICKANQH